MNQHEQSNQITKAYYDFLIGEYNRGITTKKPFKVERRNGSYIYYTYHI